MADSSLLGVVVVALITAVHCGEWCTDHSYGGHDFYPVYCDYGCCGDYYDRYCCSSSVGMIVGIVLGSLFLVGAVVTIVVCVVCCRRRRAREGHVVTTAGGATTIYLTGAAQPYVASTQAGFTAAYPQISPAYPQQGGYGNQGFAQPPPSCDTMQQQNESAKPMNST